MSCRTGIRRQGGKSPGFTKGGAQESIFPVERRLGRVLQDFDLNNANVRAGHRFSGSSVLQDILLQERPRVIPSRTGNVSERAGEPE